MKKYCLILIMASFVLLARCDKNVVSVEEYQLLKVKVQELEDGLVAMYGYNLGVEEIVDDALGRLARTTEKYQDISKEIVRVMRAEYGCNNSIEAYERLYVLSYSIYQGNGVYWNTYINIEGNSEIDGVKDFTTYELKQGTVVCK